jgi:choline dehydrogenase-like flavoprotein
MSGFFHRLKPVDFQLLSNFGPIEGANIVDWPIGYQDLEPYYEVVEREVGVSGRVVAHPHLEPRSTPDFPFPPTTEHAVAGWIDRACAALGYHAIPMPRAILSKPARGRSGCSYSGYCGSYGCATGAKGSARAALLDRAVASGRCEIRPQAMVSRLVSDRSGRVIHAEYFDARGRLQRVDAHIFVVACQAVETARLLLRSTGPRHPKGLANSSGQVGRNLLFAGGGAASGSLRYDQFTPEQAAALRAIGPFVNRSVQDWYVIEDPLFGPPQKGGTIDFLHRAPAPISRATRQVEGRKGFVWGLPLKRKLEAHFSEATYVKAEAFCDWLPNDDCFVSLDPGVKDKWGLPVARVRTGFHRRDLQVGWFLASKGAEVLEKMGAHGVVSFASGSPPTNLQAGTCRFGTDPTTSILDPDCRAHDVDNLFVSDGSFMPNAGSAPYTWTIYANAFRVGDKIASQLGLRTPVDTAAEDLG